MGEPSITEKIVFAARAMGVSQQEVLAQVFGVTVDDVRVRFDALADPSDDE